METLFELTFQDQTLSPQVGTFTDASQTAGTFTLEDGEYYLTNGDTKGFYAYKPVAMQSGLVDDSKVIIEFDLKVVTASVNTHTIIGTYAGVDGNGIPTGAKITLQYNAGDIELVLGSGTTTTLIAAADVVVDQWYHFRIDCMLTAGLESTYRVKIDGIAVTTVTGAAADYELGIISVLGTDLHACDECGIKNITFVTETNLYVGRTALDQALQDVKGYVDTHCMDLTSAQTIAGNKTFSGTVEFTSSPGVKRTSDPFYHLTTMGYNKGSNPSSNLYSGIRFFSNPNGTAQNKITGGLDMVYYASGYNAIGLNVRNYDENSNHRFFTVALRISNDSTIPVDFVPSVNASINLGSSTAQWNNAYIKALTINGTAAGDILTHNASEFVQVSDLATVALPIGSYIQFAGSQAPTGFLVCNGGEISRTTYSALFAVIGTTYGSGDGSTTFNLPNLTDRFLQGSSTSGTVKNAGLPNIAGSIMHAIFDKAVGSEAAAGAFETFAYVDNIGAGTPSGTSTRTGDRGDRFSASRSNSIYGNSDTVQPPALTCLICIKY